MNRKKILCLCTLGLFCLMVHAANGEWKKIKNSLYSLEVPSSWGPAQGMPGDGIEPGERDAREYHLHFFFWHSPVNSREDIPSCVGVEVQTYEKLDKSPLSVRDIEKAVLASRYPDRKETRSSPDELRFLIIKDSKEMDGSMVKYRKYYLLKKTGLKVHCVDITLRDELIKKQPDIEKQVQRILNSFTVVKSR